VTLRVVVADDHPMFRDGLAAMLDAQADMTVVARVGTGRAAQQAVEELQPDVAVLDMRMPDGDGASATTVIRRLSPATRVLVLTTFDAPEDVVTALSAGAHGYLVKSAAPEEIAQAVRAVASGTSVLADGVLEGLTHSVSASVRTVFPELTERETSVLAALASGLSTEGVARRLGLTAKTVRNHLASITAKLGVRDRTAAVVEARRRGLVDPQPPQDHLTDASAETTRSDNGSR
jgi:DNA-binding NarL/FixJ family response regulator